MHESGERGWRAVERGERRQREHAPYEGELAVMAVPESLKQQRAGGDGDENADEGQRPRPSQRRAVEAGGGVRHVRHDEKNRGEGAAEQIHRDQAWVGSHPSRRAHTPTRLCGTAVARALLRMRTQPAARLLNAPRPNCARRAPRLRAARRAIAPALAPAPSPSPPPARSSPPRRRAPRTRVRHAPAAASARRAWLSPATPTCATWRGG